MKTLVFLTFQSVTHDHCQECGGEENEGDTGRLKNYLVVEVGDNTGEFYKATYGAEDLCEDCAKNLAAGK